MTTPQRSLTLGLLLCLLLTACGQPETQSEETPALPPPERFTTTEANERDASWSPDGEWILFGSFSSGNEDIWKRPAGGGEAVQLTDEPFTELYAEWSPDGTRIAFSSDRGGVANVWTMSAGGGEWTRVTADADSMSAIGTSNIISWSPDGQRIAFASRQGQEAETDIHTVPTSGGPTRVIAAGPGIDDDPSWSPDGKWIAFSSGRAGNRDIWVVAADGSDSARQLTTNPSADRAPSWSPDGRWVAFQSLRSGVSDIWMVPAAGGAPVQLTDRPEHNDYVVHWSPDGRRICFNSLAAAGDLWVLRAGHEAPQPLGIRAHGNQSAWGPEGHEIAVLHMYPGDGVDVAVASRDGGAERRVTHGGSVYLGTWTSLDWSPDGQEIAFTGGQETSDIWAVSADGGEPWQVTLGPDMEIFPRYSPDGSHIIYTGRTEIGWDLWVVPTAGGIAERLTNWPTVECCASWSPDGERLVFNSLRDRDGGQTGVWQVWTSEADGSGPVWVAEGSAPAWSTDGRRILFTNEISGFGAGDLYQVAADGGDPVPILADGSAKAWPRWSPDGSEILFTGTGTGGGDIWIADVSALVR